MLAEAEAALGRDDRPAALAVLRALFRPASPLWAAQDWAHAFELAARAARGSWGARVIAALTAAAAEPSEPSVLAALGSALIDAGAVDAATGVLWRAQLAAPEGRAALAELCYALELQGQHATAVQFLEGARPTGFLEHHLWAMNALLARDRSRAERARAARPAPVDEHEAALGRALDAMLARIRTVDGIAPLDAHDERGWWYVWTGGVLGLTPAAEASPASWIRAALDVFAGALMMQPRSADAATGARPSKTRWLQTLDTPEARVLGRAASALLGRPLDLPRVPGAPGLWALPDASALPASAQVAFRWRPPEQLVFAAMADRRLPLAWCPELIGLSAPVAWSVAAGEEDAATSELLQAPLPASAPQQLAELGRFLAMVHDSGSFPGLGATTGAAPRAPWVRPGPEAWTSAGWAFARTPSEARALPCRFPQTHQEVQERRPRASIPALDEALGWLQAGRWAYALQRVQPVLEKIRTADDWRVGYQVLATAMQHAGDAAAAERLNAAKAQPQNPAATGAAAEAMAQAGRYVEAAAILAWTTALAPTTPRWLEAMCAVLVAGQRPEIAARLVADLGTGGWIAPYWRAWEALRQGDAPAARAAWQAIDARDLRRRAWLGLAITRLELIAQLDAPALGDARVRHWIDTGVVALHVEAARDAHDLAVHVAAVAQALGHAEVAAIAVPSAPRVSEVLALAVAELLDRPPVPAESGYSLGAALVVAAVEEVPPPSAGRGPRAAFWSEGQGPQRAAPEVRATLALGTPTVADAFAGRAPAEAAAALAAAARAAQTTLDPIVAGLVALARAHPELGPRGEAHAPFGYWPGAPWPELARPESAPAT